jgi:hypothetical protein
MCLLRGTFCPHSVFMCFLWIWEQTAIISLYSINWLVFITEAECVYCAVGTRSLYVVQVSLNLSRAVPWFRWLVAGLLPRKPRFGPWPIHVKFVADKLPLGRLLLTVGILQFSPVSIIPPLPHTHLHLNVALTTRTKGEAWEPSENQCSIVNRGALDRTVLSLSSLHAFKGLR